mmetsp:Transcript_11047/g.32428  ORF Transcript_11047/g.32428 Transcript_11047/m.32428 type:complete len:291 (+) Transcript_11047:43-915(+)
MTRKSRRPRGVEPHLCVRETGLALLRFRNFLLELCARRQLWQREARPAHGALAQRVLLEDGEADGAGVPDVKVALGECAHRARLEPRLRRRSEQPAAVLVGQHREEQEAAQPLLAAALGAVVDPAREVRLLESMHHTVTGEAAWCHPMPHAERASCCSEIESAVGASSTVSIATSSFFAAKAALVRRRLAEGHSAEALRRRTRGWASGSSRRTRSSRQSASESAAASAGAAASESGSRATRPRTPLARAVRSLCGGATSAASSRLSGHSSRAAAGCAPTTSRRLLDASDQ